MLNISAISQKQECEIHEEGEIDPTDNNNISAKRAQKRENECNAICKVIYDNIKNKTCVNADAIFFDMLFFSRGGKNDPFFIIETDLSFFTWKNKSLDQQIWWKIPKNGRDKNIFDFFDGICFLDGCHSHSTI